MQSLGHLQAQNVSSECLPINTNDDDGKFHNQRVTATEPITNAALKIQQTVPKNDVSLSHLANLSLDKVTPPNSAKVSNVHTQPENQDQAESSNNDVHMASDSNTSQSQNIQQITSLPLSGTEMAASLVVTTADHLNSPQERHRQQSKVMPNICQKTTPTEVKNSIRRNIRLRAHCLHSDITNSTQLNLFL